MRRRIYVFINLLVVLAFFIFLSSCNKAKNEARNEVSRNRSIEKSAITIPEEITSELGIEYTRANTMAIFKTIFATGKVSANANKVAIVGPIVSGRVSRIFVNPGEIVKKGDPLVELESVELGRAKSEYYSAKTQFEVDSINYVRQKNLFEKNIGSRKDLLLAEAEFKKSRSEFFTAERNLHLMGLSEEDVRKLAGKNHEMNPIVQLVSPIDGTVVERNVILGEKVDQESNCLLYTSPSPRDLSTSRMPSSA